MKEIKTERTVYDISYEAVDGTSFTNKEECEKYDNSALGVLRGKVKEFAVNKPVDEWELLGGEDHMVIGFAIPHPHQIDIFLQWLLLECPWYSNEHHVERWAEIQQIIKKTQEQGDIILMGQNCDGDFYFINSRQNIIDNLMNLDKKER